MLGARLLQELQLRHFPLLAVPIPGARILYGLGVLGAGIAGYYYGSDFGGNLYKKSGLDDATNFDYTLKDMGLPDLTDLFQSSNRELNLNPEQYSTNVIINNVGGGESQVPEINVPGENASNIPNVASSNNDNPYLINSLVQYNVGSVA